MHARSTAALVLLFAGCIAGTDARADVGPAGDYVERIPIAVPSFRGLEPSLAFVYSSNAGRGLLGAGWALDGFSQVRRTSQGRGLAGSAGPDVFELDGVELLPCATSPADPRRAASPSCRHPAPAPLVAYTARIETHRRIAFDPTPAGGAWHVWSRSGDRAVYRPSTSGDAWVLASVENPLGQRIEYAYRKFSPGTFGVAHPDEIRYGATVVRFLWQPRPDPSTLAQGAELLTLSHRLVAVQVETEGTTARAYSLGYETHVDTGRSVLTTIREFGRGAGVAADGTVTGDSHPAPRFAYAAATASAEWRGDERAVGPLDWRPSPALDQYTYEATSLSLPLLHASFAAADVDADGRSDGVLATVREGSPDAELQLDVRLASNAWVRTVLPFAKPGAWFLGDPPFDGRHQLLRVWTGDVDGDRREDMIVVAWRNETTNDPYNRLVLLLRVALSNGDGTFSWATGAFQDTGWVTPVAWAYTSMFRNTAPNCATGDVDGNGRTDFACTLHTGVSRQSLAIAYGRGAGDFQIGTPVQVADDPGVLTNATGAPAVIAYETRPMAIADVDRDGLADVLLLEPRATDLTACAAAGDPADVRARCTIRYDIATGISDGIGFAFERTPTPWVREDQRSVAPGSLVAADVNGDGRADVIHLPGQVFGEREQTLRAIGVALRRDGGQFAFSTQTLPTSLAGVRMQYAFGDVDGDLRTDLVAAVRIPPGGGRSCSAAAFDRALLFRVRADAGGRFQLPANWLDCSEGAEVAAQWARWTELDLEGALQIADTNGDGLADVLRPTAWTRIPDREALFAVSDAVSAPSPDAEGRWAAVDVDGDRRVDLVRVSGQNGTSWAYVRRPNAGGLTADVQSLPRFGHNGDASWRWLDLNGDGRTDLLHVQCEIRAAAGGCELRLDAWLARRGASGFDAMAAAVFPGRSARDAALTWMTGDVDGDGRADLVAVDPAPGTPARLQVRAMTSRGDGRFDESVRTVDVSAIGPSSAVLANVAGWRVADVNGDGRIDLIHLTPQSGSVRVATLIAVPGKDWRAAVAVVQHPAALPTAVLRARASPLRWHVLDANGDGASDLVRQAITDTGGVWFHTLLSEGAGTWSPRAFAAPAPANLLAGTDFGGLGWLPLDVDADGDADLVRLDSSAASVAVTTARSDARGGWTLGQQAVGGSRSVAQDVERYGWTLGDLDGDGRAEFLRARGSGGTLRLSRIGGSEISDRLVRTSLAGADARITYGDPGPAVVADTTAECALPVGVAPRVVRIRDRVAGRDVVTAFTFDARDQLRRVVDPGGNVTTYSYDRLGRTLAVDDPNFGRRTFDYDPVGNLLAATDARGRTTRYAYDARGRLQAKTPPFGGPITWVYDEPGAGASRGRLTSTIDPTGNGCAGGVTERRRYDAIGRLSAMEKCVRGQTRVIGFGYNALNHVESLTYPDGEVVRYAYDAAGALESVSGWIDRVAYAADGTVERIDYANGTRLRLERDPVIGAVADERVTTANRTLYASRYEYAADGTLLTARSRTNGVDLAYTHDELGRLTAVTGTQQQSWNYDGAGNMTFNSALGKYAYPAQGPTACGGAPCAQPQGVRSAGPLSLTYDANGLVSQVVDSRSGRTRAIDWTPEGRPMLVVDFDATPTLYSYDAFGRRVVDETPTEIVRHFGHLVDESSVTGTTKYYFAGSRLIGASTGGVKRWFHADRAGAVRLVTGPGGAVLARLDHTPFGAPLSPATTASGAGAGFGLDAGPGMLLLGARAYDPTLGRFLGPDVIVPSMLETQAYNRYAFVYNAPTAWVDPSGHQAIGLEDTVRGPSGGVWMGSSWMHQPWLSAASGPPGAGMLGGAPTSLSLSPLSSWRDGYRSVGTEASVDDGADEPGIFDLMADNALELGFGGVVGGIQGLAPVGWLVPLEKVADHLDMSTGQKMWFEVGRGSALTAIGIAETVEGLSLMAAGAPPTAIGAVTVETGIGGLLLAGGATIEVAGAAVAAEGLADAGVGLSVLLRSGVYVLIDRRTVRYTGKAKKFSSRKSSHKESKPRHQFREVFKDVKDPDVRSGLEQILLELCRTCNWNRINGISPENRRYIEKMFKTFEWLEKQGIPMPKSLDEVLKRQGVLK